MDTHKIGCREEIRKRGSWATIHSPDKNNCCIFANAMQHSSSIATATGTNLIMP